MSSSAKRATANPRSHAIGVDARAAATCTAFGCVLFALVELIVSTWAVPTFPGFWVWWRFAATAFALSAILFVPLFAGLLATSLAVRTLVWALKKTPWGKVPALLGPAKPTVGVAKIGAVVWAGLLFAATFVGLSTLLIKTLVPRFKEPLLTAGLISVLQLVVVAIALVIGVGAYFLTRALAKKLAPRLGSFNPFAHGMPAVVLAFAVAIGPVLLLLSAAPHLRPLVPWRLGLSLTALACGVVVARRVGLPAFLKGARRPLLIAALTYLVLVPMTLLYWGADPGSKSMAVTSSPALAKLIDGVRFVNDVDRDGYGSLLGESDCAPFDPLIHPLAPEIADNGRDENCDGRDLELARMQTKMGETPPVPDAFKRDWNILLLTVDTVRYDHTSFGGYIEKSGRDTTPNLAELVKRSASFSFANAPSAGTMASIPAIVTSKFFHSGIALGPDRRGMPPITKPENLLLPEILKDAGYQTGAILTHHYFNDWGLRQGFDTYDNSIGEKSKPRDVSSDRLTDRVLSWIGNHSKKKWFLWAHYLDPHGRYVDHPGEVSYGTTEKDLYDGELHFTDKHLGRLFKELAHIPGVAENTIIILTSDHGDAFNEHGFINHGQALYRELLHVPLIIYVPSIQPRVIPGPVSPIDIMPTILDLVGIDRSRYSFEGTSLIAQLFYGQDARDRVVFSETNFPRPIRAAISDRYKLVRKLQENIYELYDLHKDPWEKKNIYRTDKKAFAEMNAHLEEWLERVYYSRDSLSNQAMMKLKDVLLPEAPNPAHKTTASFDDGRIELLGFDVKPIKNKKGASTKLDVSIYFRATARPVGDYKIQALAWEPKKPDKVKKSPAKLTAGGKFPTSRWRKGEFVKHRSVITAPPNGTWVLALKLLSGSRTLEASGGTATQVSGTTLLGEVELAPKVPEPLDAGPAPLTPKPNIP